MWVLECLLSSRNLVLVIYAGFVHTSTVLLSDESKRVTSLARSQNNPQAFSQRLFERSKAVRRGHRDVLQ